MMDILKVKHSLHEFIDEIDDNRLLYALYAFSLSFSKQGIKNDFWDNLPIEVQKAINESLAEEENDLVDHEHVMKKYAKWL